MLQICEYYIMLDIFTYSAFESIYNLMQINKYFNQIANDNYLWLLFLKNQNSLKIVKY